MKKIFTLLFCVTAMSLAANASNLDMVHRCINVLLGNEQQTTITAPNLDANHDGVINIADVTTLIDMSLMNEGPAMAPAQSGDVNSLINDILDNEPPKPEIKDVTNAIDKKIVEE